MFLFYVVNSEWYKDVTTNKMKGLDPVIGSLENGILDYIAESWTPNLNEYHPFL